MCVGIVVARKHRKTRLRPAGRNCEDRVQMNNHDTKPRVALRVIWIDDDLIELACSVVSERFAGDATCYTSSEQLHDFAETLSRFCLTAEGEATFESGLGDGSKACNFRAYTTDRAGHMAIHIRLATEKLTARPQSIARLELEIPVEAWSLSQFAEQLRQIAKTRTGEALLAVRAEDMYI
jgi:hypothetical protein